MENKVQQPYDLRLAILRLLMQWRRILLITVSGILLLGGGYLIKYVVLSPPPMYEARSTYYVEYGTDPVTGNAYTYINAYSWNEWLHTEEFLDDIFSRLEGVDMSREELGGVLRADLPSDLRMPVTLVTTGEADRSLNAARAVEESMVAFADRQKEIDSIRVVSSAREGDRVKADVRPIRALIFSAVVSFLTAVLFLFIRDTYLLGIWLPIQVKRDLEVPCLEPGQKEVKSHMSHLLRGCIRVGILPVSGEEGFLEKALEICSEPGRDCRVFPPGFGRMDYEGLEAMEGVILVAECGEREGGRLRQRLEELDMHGIAVKGVILFGVSPLLQRAYYGMTGKEPV